MINSCKHGQLARSCEICELEQQIAATVEQSEAAWRELDDERVAYINRIGDILGQVGEDSLEDTAARVMRQLSGCNEVIDQLKKAIFHLTEAANIGEQQLAAKDAEIERLRTAFNVWSNSDECQKNDVLLCLAFKEK